MAPTFHNTGQPENDRRTTTGQTGGRPKRNRETTTKREDEEKERRKEEERREKLREQQELLLVQGVGAAIALGEATAKAVQRIPDAHCNGDMHAALDYAAKVKHEQKDFLARQGIEALYD